jgi:hypothetical protein
MKHKCFLCGKKLNTILLNLYICRCTNYYCRKHMFSHDCKYQYLVNNQIALNQNMIKPIDNKINRI